MMRPLPFFVIACSALLLAACTKPGSSGSPQAALPAELAGTSWQLVEFQSADSTVGVIAPADPSRYQMTLAADGKVSMQADCNRVHSTWTATAAATDSGSFAFHGLSTTLVLCPPPSLGRQITNDLGAVETYLLRDGKLFLGLADASTYQWEPL